jgi:DNA-directed RNA polymerase subunit L
MNGCTVTFYLDLEDHTLGNLLRYILPNKKKNAFIKKQIC